MASRLDRVSDWEAEGRSARYQLKALVAAKGVTLRRLEQFFRRRGWAPPREWLARLRMDDALRKLKTGAPSKTVSPEVGFTHPPSFHRAFRKEFGCSPGQYFCDGGRGNGKISRSAN